MTLQKWAILPLAMFVADGAWAQDTASTEVIEVANDVPECPAFDVIQRRILEVTRGAAGGDNVVDGGSQDPVAIEIIFDASGSMAARLGGDAKIDIARQALSAALLKLDTTSALVGVRAYGFDASVEKTASASCPNTQLISGFQMNGARQHLSAVTDLQPYGYTPIAASLMAAGNDLAGQTARDRMILLVSDGEETCDGDPAAMAKELQQSGVAVATYVVGFDLDAAQKAEMQSIALNGGGPILMPAMPIH